MIIDKELIFSVWRQSQPNLPPELLEEIVAILVNSLEGRSYRLEGSYLKFFCQRQALEGVFDLKVFQDLERVGRKLLKNRLQLENWLEFWLELFSQAAVYLNGAHQSLASLKVKEEVRRLHLFLKLGGAPDYLFEPSAACPQFTQEDEHE